MSEKVSEKQGKRVLVDSFWISKALFSFSVFLFLRRKEE